jgi:2-(1,2-epoxy-1,2-dihydrophenyl)acetyl-CoA isomerase
MTTMGTTGAASFETILVKHEDGIATITFNRPEKRNALTIRFFEEFMEALQRIEDDGDIRVLVLAGAGPAFCAGRDFSEAKTADPASAARYLRLNFEGRDRLRRFSKPVVGRIHGPASGGGCAIAMECCDIPVASKSARFSIREVQAGSVPGLPLFTLGRVRTLGMVLTGDWISGEQAEQWGLVYKTVADEQLDETVDKIAKQLAAQPVESLKYTKRAMCYMLDLAGYTQTEQYLAECRTLVQQAPQRQQVLTAFLDKSGR